MDLGLTMLYREKYWFFNGPHPANYPSRILLVIHPLQERFRSVESLALPFIRQDQKWEPPIFHSI
jgi:hypothetical protein